MFDQLGDGVYRRRYESLDLNVGVVVGDEAVLVVDTRSTTSEAEELRAELRQLTSLPVRWVVNTHWHFDHTFGNGVFADVEIWGHELCQKALAERGEDMLAGAREWLAEERHGEIEDLQIVPPTNVFSETASIDIGRRVEMSYHGLGHTDADIVVAVPGADVAFFGDLVEEGAPPSFGDSYPVSWPSTLGLASFDLPATVVPGHGDVVGPSFVRSQHEELTAVADLATALLGGDLVFEEAVGAGPYSEKVMRNALLRAQAVGL